LSRDDAQHDDYPVQPDDFEFPCCSVFQPAQSTKFRLQ
jgi:hypothetical protein